MSIGRFYAGKMIYIWRDLALTECENFLRAVRFDKPEYIPMRLNINSACWHHYPQDGLKALMASHPFLFPDFENSTERVQPEYLPWQLAGEPYIDPWGCIW